MRALITIFLLILSIKISTAITLVVPSGPYADIEAAAAVANAGDTILVENGTYTQRQNLSSLAGSPGNLIYILAETQGLVIWQGGSEAWHLSDCEYLHISGFIFQGQTSNGVNIDDAGTFATPTHHIIIENCVFRNMAGGGNNDLLKLSGLDTFEIRNCSFLNGAPGGSGIDMVGCHMGLIEDNLIDAAGVTGIQAKGGTQFVRIEGNTLKNMGQRALNLGGSTGLAFFRPQGINYEAADLQVYSNVFINSWAPIAFVGCVRVEVINNTIYLPDNWIIRILQETTEPGFLPCGDNTFSNNIIVRNNSVSTDVNIGPNTASSTFTFSNNLWFHTQNASWTGPNLPATETDGIIQQDPLLVDPGGEDFNVGTGSPAIAAGLGLAAPSEDLDNNPFVSPRAIGAQEDNSILPITLVSFFVEVVDQKYVSLEWQTSFEEGVEIIKVMRSHGASAWKTIGEIAPSNVVQLNNYQYTDNEPYFGSNMYQLNFVNFDGTIDRSPVQVVQMTNERDWFVYPTVIQKSVVLKLIPDWREKADVIVSDVHGRLLKVQPVDQVGTNSIAFKLPEGITAGSYFLTLLIDGQNAGTRMIIMP